MHFKKKRVQWTQRFHLENEGIATSYNMVKTTVVSFKNRISSGLHGKEEHVSLYLCDGKIEGEIHYPLVGFNSPVIDLQRRKLSFYLS